jgi:ketosteroid isomerase-like protein
MPAVTTFLSLSMLTGCVAMKENMVEQGLNELAALYENKDIDGIRAGTAPGHMRTIPDGTELTGEALDEYIVDLLEANDNIKIELLSLAVSKDRIFVEYTFSADSVGPTMYGPDMTGHSYVNRVVSIMELDGRDIVSMRDYWDYASYSKDAGYELMRPPAEPEAPAAPEAAEEAAEEEAAEGDSE